MLRSVPIDWSSGPSTGKGTDSAEHQSTYIQEHGSEEEIHDQVTGEAERNEVKESEEGMEDDNAGATAEIRKSRNESKDSKDEDTLEEDTLEDEETLEEDDDGDNEEPSGISMHFESTHRAGGASTDTSNGSYCLVRLSGSRQSSEELATTIEGQG